MVSQIKDGMRISIPIGDKNYQTRLRFKRFTLKYNMCHTCVETKQAKFAKKLRTLKDWGSAPENFFYLN